MYELWESVNELVPDDMRQAWADEDSESQEDSDELSGDEQDGEKQNVR